MAEYNKSVSKFLREEGDKAVARDLRQVFDNRTEVLHSAYSSGSREQDVATEADRDEKSGSVLRPIADLSY